MADAKHRHSQVIAAEARQILEPLGLAQRGRSRIWLDDQGWYVVMVEFQPGWSRGSYLNVGCNWLWSGTDVPAFDLGYRVEGFHEYQSDEQFVPVARRLAHRASEAVLHYRALVPTPRALAAHYKLTSPNPGWPSFNAAIAFGLCGDADAARRLFAGAFGSAAADSRDWVVKARADAEHLSTLVADSARLGQEIRTLITRARELRRLPPLANPLPA